MSGITFPEVSKFAQAPQDFSGCDPFEMPLHIEKTSLAFNNLASLCIPIVAAAVSYKKLGAHLSRTWIPIALATVASLAINIYIRSQLKSHFFHKKTTQLFDRLINVLKPNTDQLKKDLEILQTVFAKSSWQCPSVADHYRFYECVDRVTQEICSTQDIVMRSNWFDFLKRVNGQFLIHRPDRSFIFNPVFQFVELSKESTVNHGQRFNPSYLRGLTSIPEICEDNNQVKRVTIQPITDAFDSEVESEHFKGTTSNSWLKMLPSWITTLPLKYSYRKKVISLLASCLGKDLSQIKALWEESRRAGKSGDILLIKDNTSGLGIFACIPYHESSRGVFDVHALAVNPNVPSSFNIKTRMLEVCLSYFKTERLHGREQLFVRVFVRSSDKAEQAFYLEQHLTQGPTVPGYFKDPTETAISFSIQLN